MDSKRLLELCQEKGISYSEKQLRDYHKAGLIPEPKTKSMGRGKGSSTEYPDETIEILLSISDLKNNGIRKNDDIAWNLFMTGYNHISVDKIKGIIFGTKILEEIKNAKEKINPEFDALDMAEQIIESERGKKNCNLIPKDFSSLSDKDLEPIIKGLLRTSFGDISFFKEFENEAEVEYIGSLYSDQLEKIKNDAGNKFISFLGPLLDESILEEMQYFLENQNKGFIPKLVHFAGLEEGVYNINPLTLRTSRIYIKLMTTFLNLKPNKKEASCLIPLLIKMQIKNKYILSENELDLIEEIIFRDNVFSLAEFMKITGIIFNR